MYVFAGAYIKEKAFENCITHQNKYTNRSEEKKTVKNNAPESTMQFGLFFFQIISTKHIILFFFCGLYFHPLFLPINIFNL